MELNEAAHYLQQVYESLAPELQRHTLNATVLSATYGYQHDVDRMVEKEMRRIKENCLRLEEQYVEQMLLENPITIERRTNNNGTVASGIAYCKQHQSDEDVDVVTISPPKSYYSDEQQKRAEQCRNSRLNNKIKKAKSKYRHKFISEKILTSTQMFDCIQDLIKKVESHLFNQGLPEERLRHLSRIFGVDISANKLRRWQHLMKYDK